MSADYDRLFHSSDPGKPVDDATITVDRDAILKATSTPPLVDAVGFVNGETIEEAPEYVRFLAPTYPVAVLPEAEEVDVTIHPNDLRIDVFRSVALGARA